MRFISSVTLEGIVNFLSQIVSHSFDLSICLDIKKFVSEILLYLNKL